MEKVKVRVINKSDNPMSEYKTPFSAGMDIRAYITEDESWGREICLKPLERRLIHTGLYFQLPPNYEMQIRPRSGFALEYGITVVNSPGTVDADYRGEVGVILINLSNEDVEIKSGDRIAQLVIKPYIQAELYCAKELDVTERGEGGFGHT